MKLRPLTTALAIAVFLLLAGMAQAQDEDTRYPADAYTSCAACHLPDGAGVPSAFPPLKDRAAEIAALSDGRAYLITVVSYGLMGNITIDGVPFFGVMAGNAAAMSSEELAAALNYIVFELSGTDTSYIDPFSADEVAAVQAQTEPKSPAAGAALRKDLLAAHGDEWP